MTCAYVDGAIPGSHADMQLQMTNAVYGHG